MNAEWTGLGRSEERRARKRSLAIVERAFRGSVEEQYGHIVWLSGVMRAMRAEHNLLLRGNAVVFAAKAQPQLYLSISGERVAPLSNYATALTSLFAAGAEVYAFEPDVRRFGFRGRLLDQVVLVDEAAMVALCESHDYVWYW